MIKYDVKVGDKYGRWTVLETNVINPKSKAKNPPKMALCQCECGTKRYKEYRDLCTRSISCGCYRGELLTQRNKNNSSVKVGNKYGRLTVIEDLGFRIQKRGTQESWYRCQCECGNITEINGNNLQSGCTKSCGCISSRGENTIEMILKQNNVNYIKEYVFKDLKDIHPLRFDFAVLNPDNSIKFLIEFDGRQHFLGPDATWSKSDSLETIQHRDNLKNMYCKKNNIILKRIPYLRIGDISLTTLMDDTFTFYQNYSQNIIKNK